MGRPGACACRRGRRKKAMPGLVVAVHAMLRRTNGRAAQAFAAIPSADRDEQSHQCPHRTAGWFWDGLRIDGDKHRVTNIALIVQPFVRRRMGIG